MLHETGVPYSLTMPPTVLHMQDRVNTLDVGATVHLLASYGRLDDLMHYATFRQASA